MNINKLLPLAKLCDRITYLKTVHQIKLNLILNRKSTISIKVSDDLHSQIH